jgi:hypothetical protein
MENCLPNTYVVPTKRSYNGTLWQTLSSPALDATPSAYARTDSKSTFFDNLKADGRGTTRPHMGSLDHLVSLGEKRRWDSEAKGLGGLEVND